MRGGEINYEPFFSDANRIDSVDGKGGLEKKPDCTSEASRLFTASGSLTAETRFLHVKEAVGMAEMPGWQPSCRPEMRRSVNSVFG